MLLQAADFLHLYRTGHVEMQMGGADQWGNITAGLELIRKEFGAGDGQDLAFGLSYPLLTNESGAKYGKTAAGTSVWLDPARTSPFAFYQYWLDADDRDIGKYLRTFTLFDRARVRGPGSTAGRLIPRPVSRSGRWPTTSRRGCTAKTRRRRRFASAKPPSRRSRSAIPRCSRRCTQRSTASSSRPRTRPAAPCASPLSAASTPRTATPAEPSAQGGLSINDERVKAPEDAVPAPIAGRYLVLRAGKKNLRIGRLKP